MLCFVIYFANVHIINYNTKYNGTVANIRGLFL